MKYVIFSALMLCTPIYAMEKRDDPKEERKEKERPASPPLWQHSDFQYQNPFQQQIIFLVNNFPELREDAKFLMGLQAASTKKEIAESKAPQRIALLQAFMAGSMHTYTSENEEDRIQFKNGYRSCYDWALKDAYEELTDMHTIMRHTRMGWKALPIERELFQEKKQKNRLAILNKLTDSEKLELQMIRFDEFHENKDLLDAPKNTDIKAIKANRQALMVAMKNCNAKAIKDACTKKLHPTKFKPSDEYIKWLKTITRWQMIRESVLTSKTSSEKK